MSYDELIEKGLKVHAMKSGENYEGECPSSREIMAYARGEGEEEQKASIAEHLTLCSLCTETVLALNANPELMDEMASIDVHGAWENFNRRMQSFDPSPPLEDSEEIRTVTAPLMAARKSLFPFSLQEFWAIILQQRVLAITAAAAIIIAIPIIYIGRQESANIFYDKDLKTELSQTLRGSANPVLIDGLEAFKRGDFAQAKAQLTSALENDPSSYEACYFLGRFYLVSATSGWRRRPDTHEINKGIHYLQKAGDLSPNPSFRADCCVYLAQAYVMKGDTPRAKEYLESALNIPGSSDSLQRRKQQATDLLKQMDRSK